MLHAIASAFIGGATFISSLFGITSAPGPSLGAALPSGSAVFETSLQSRISSTDTSMTLVANSVRGGSSLSGYNCFTVDEGRTDAEYVCGTVSGTSVTSLTRGIDPATGTSTNSVLKFAHRVGADVKITDFPLLQILRNQANGADTYDHALTYASGVTPANTGDLTDKEYVDGIAFSGAGVIDASVIAKGVVELATQTEIASSSSAGSSGNLVIPATAATSTYNSATAPLRVVVTQNSGKIDNNFIATSTLFATSSIAGGPIGYVGKNMQVFSSTGTSTFTVPSGIAKVLVEVQGPGGTGAQCASGGGSNSYAGGGGAGGYASEFADVTGTTSIQVHVGAGQVGAATPAAPDWTTFGTNGSYLYATGGTYPPSLSDGGTPGQGVGGDINMAGQGGSGAASVNNSASGAGGTAHLGGGGRSVTGNNDGSAGGNYGGGGAGGACTQSSQTHNGGTGGQGIVIVRW
jgi:hypothetical protein